MKQLENEISRLVAGRRDSHTSYLYSLKCKLDMWSHHQIFYDRIGTQLSGQLLSRDRCGL